MDTGGKDSGDVGTASDAGDRGPAVTSVGCKLTGEGIGDSWTLSGGGHEAATTSCGGPASSWQSDEVGDRRGAAAGTCGGEAWAGEGNIGGTGNGWASSAVRESVRTGACRASAGADSWGDGGVTTAGSREGGGAKGTGSSGNEACRGDCVWALCCGYTSRMAALKSSQVLGSGKASRVRAKVSHVGPSV